MKKRMVSLLVLLVLLLTVLTGCSGGKEEKNTSSLNTVLLTPYVFEEQANALEASINAGVPQLTTETARMKLTYISGGDSEKDPYSTMAAVAQMGGMMAGKEIELLICDKENARRYAENGEAYMPLGQLFTEEEVAELGLAPACVELSDDEGNLTGQLSQPCGVDLSGCTALEEMLRQKNLGAYVIVNSANVDNARAVIRHLAGMK